MKDICRDGEMVQWVIAFAVFALDSSLVLRTRVRLLTKVQTVFWSLWEPSTTYDRHRNTPIHTQTHAATHAYTDMHMSIHGTTESL